MTPGRTHDARADGARCAVEWSGDVHHMVTQGSNKSFPTCVLASMTR